MSLEVQNNMRSLIAVALGKVSLNGAAVAQDSWSSFESSLLNFCLAHNVISYDKLKTIIAGRITWLGQVSYGKHILSHISPKKAASPQALAYIIRTGGLTEKEVASISFDDGEDSSTFCKDVDGDFVEEIIELLRKEEG